MRFDIHKMVEMCKWRIIYMDQEDWGKVGTSFEDEQFVCAGLSRLEDREILIPTWNRNDTDTLAHEAGHVLDFEAVMPSQFLSIDIVFDGIRFLNAYPNKRDYVVSYEGMAKVKQELWAEIFSIWASDKDVPDVWEIEFIRAMKYIGIID